MSRQETNHSKYSKCKKQYVLYDEFLISEQLTFKQRSDLIWEMARINNFTKEVEHMTFNELKKTTDDYTIQIPSKINACN